MRQQGLIVRNEIEQEVVRMNCKTWAEGNARIETTIGSVFGTQTGCTEWSAMGGRIFRPSIVTS